MSEYGIGTSDGVKANEGVARVDKWFHCLLYKLIFVILHCPIIFLLTHVGTRHEQPLEPIRMQILYELVVVSTILDLQLNTKLLREVGNDQNRAN